MRRHTAKRSILILALGLAMTACGSTDEAPMPDPARAPTADHSTESALWITRWDYRSASDVLDAIDRAAALGVTDVFWQVRGQADAFYRSALEPWGQELLGTTGRTDPGFDPLTLAVSRAHSRGLRLHAWINVMPMWKGTEPPESPLHMFNTRSAWRLSDRDGKVQPLNEHYVVVNPVRDDVHDHIVAVAADLVSRYDIDGLHLDYIRFVSESFDHGRLYPGDPQSMRAFEAATGVSIDAAAKEPYRDWIRDRITDLVWRIRGELTQIRPELELSAAVWRRPEIGRDQYLQDAVRWLDEDLIDFVVPMIYSDDDTRFADDLRAWRAATEPSKVMAGIGVYKHAGAAQTIDQIELVGSARFALFAYSTLFESADPNQVRTSAAITERSIRAGELTRYLRSPIKQRP